MSANLARQMNSVVVNTTARKATGGSAQLRAAVADRLVQSMKEINERMGAMLESAVRTGVLSAPPILSESTLTFSLWKEALGSAEVRGHMFRTLGLTSVADRSLLEALMGEVHQAFVEFKAGAGREMMQRHEDMVCRYEAANVVLVLASHDNGPMAGELARLGLELNPEFTRSILVSEQVVAVSASFEQGADEASRTVVTGVTVPQLGTLIAQIRRLNPRLTNRQVRNLLVRATSEAGSSRRKSLGHAEARKAQEMALQLLRLQVVSQLAC